MLERAAQGITAIATVESQCMRETRYEDKAIGPEKRYSQDSPLRRGEMAVGIAESDT